MPYNIYNLCCGNIVGEDDVTLKRDYTKTLKCTSIEGKVLFINANDFH